MIHIRRVGNVKMIHYADEDLIIIVHEMDESPFKSPSATAERVIIQLNNNDESERMNETGRTEWLLINSNE